MIWPIRTRAGRGTGQLIDRAMEIRLRRADVILPLHSAGPPIYTTFVSHVFPHRPHFCLTIFPSLPEYPRYYPYYYDYVI